MLPILDTGSMYEGSPRETYDTRTALRCVYWYTFFREGF